MTETELKRIIAEVMDEKIGALYIDRETHFLDHKFIEDVRTTGERVKSHACKVVTGGGIGGLGLLLFWGLIKWIEGMGFKR